MATSDAPLPDEPGTEQPPPESSSDTRHRSGDTGAATADDAGRPGTTPMPDADEAPRADDLLPDDPPPDAVMTGDPAKKTAIEAPVPAHGGIASAEQLAEGERAEELDEHRDDPPART